jgi:hypothetical protein
MNMCHRLAVMMLTANLRGDVLRGFELAHHGVNIIYMNTLYTYISINIRNTDTCVFKMITFGHHDTPIVGSTAYGIHMKQIELCNDHQ